MDLGTTGAILSFALALEERKGAFYSKHVAEVHNPSLRQAFEEIQRDQRKRERILSRFRRENVTEMILEPIHGFDSDEFELTISSEELHDDTTLQKSAIKIEENSQSFFLKASEKTTFLPEVSDQFKRFSDSAGNRAKLLKSIL